MTTHRWSEVRGATWEGSRPGRLALREVRQGVWGKGYGDLGWRLELEGGRLSSGAAAMGSAPHVARMWLEIHTTVECVQSTSTRECRLMVRTRASGARNRGSIPRPPRSLLGRVV